MNTKDYIKVTPKGSERTVVVKSGNRDFYLSQGALVERATEEEILEFFPEERFAQLPILEVAQKVIEELEAKKAVLMAEIEALKNELAAIKAESKPARKTTKKQL